MNTRSVNRLLLTISLLSIGAICTPSEGGERDSSNDTETGCDATYIYEDMDDCTTRPPSPISPRGDEE